MASIRTMLDYDYVVQALMQRTPYSKIAARESGRLSIPVSRNVIAGVHRDLKYGNLSVTNATQAKKANIKSLLNRPTFIHGVDPADSRGIPLYNGHLTVNHDRVMGWNDLHGTAVDIGLLEKTDDIRKEFDIDTLIIGGDLGNNEAISKHRRRSLRYDANLSLEIQVMTEILEWAADRYQQIYLIPGNHDMWLVEAVDGALSYTDLMKMIIQTDKVRSRVKVSEYDRITLQSGERTWTIPHQAGYSPNPLVVAQKLSERFETDIYTTHQHFSAGPVRSKNGKHILMDVGGLFDPNKFAYSNMRTTAGRVMTQGFATIINGKPRLWTPDNLMTDWV